MAENRRVRMTKRLMKDALLELLEVKPLEKITVTDVCAAADVNRSSFYAHYQDIHALLRELEDEVLEHIPVPEGPIGADSAFPAALELYFDHVQQNARLFRALILRREDARFDRRLVDAVMARNRPPARGRRRALCLCVLRQRRRGAAARMAGRGLPAQQPGDGAAGARALPRAAGAALT